jgi:hypothetical protein
MHDKGKFGLKLFRQNLSFILFMSMFISLSKKSLEQRFFSTPMIGVFVYHECTMRQHAEMGDVLNYLDKI